MATIRKLTYPPKKNGKRSVAYELNYMDGQGVRHRQAFATKAEAEEKRDRVLIDRRMGNDARGADAETFTEGAEYYLDIAEKVGRNGRPPIEPETVKAYRACIDAHVLPKTGSKRLSETRPPDVVAFRDWLVLESGLGDETARMAFMHYKGILQEGFNRGKVPANVWSGISIARSEAPPPLFDHELGLVKGTIPSKTEVSTLIVTAAQLRSDPRPLMDGHDPDAPWQKYSPSEGPRGWLAVKLAWAKNYVLLLTAVLTGLRGGEIRALHWVNVNLDQKVIFVKQAATAGGRLKGPKSRAGYRAVDMPAVLADELKAWRKVNPKAKMVFPTASGKVMSKQSLDRNLWRRLCEFAGIEGHGFHSLRHHYASQRIARGANAKELQKDMGHASIQVTYNIYGHLFPEDRSERRVSIEGMATDLLAPDPGTDREDATEKGQEKSIRH